MKAESGPLRDMEAVTAKGVSTSGDTSAGFISAVIAGVALLSLRWS